MKALTFILLAFFIGQIASAGSDEFVTPYKRMPCADGKGYKVHMTFDDGPQSPNTETVLAKLEKINGERRKKGKKPIQATFLLSMCHFRDPDCNNEKMTPKKMKKLVDLVKRMVADGHIVGNHSGDHISHAQEAGIHEKDKKGKDVKDSAGNPVMVPPEEQSRVIQQNLKESFTLMRDLRKVVSLKDPIPFRFPYGDGWIQSTNPRDLDRGNKSMAAVQAEGFMPLHWDIDSWDWSKIKRRYLPDSVLNQICSHHGGVVLDHDIHKFTADNIDTLIKSIEDSGHEFATLAEIRKESEKEHYVSFATKAYWYKNCGGRIGDKDQAWSSCEAYRTRSTDLGNPGAVSGKE